MNSNTARHCIAVLRQKSCRNPSRELLQLEYTKPLPQKLSENNSRLRTQNRKLHGDASTRFERERDWITYTKRNGKLQTATSLKNEKSVVCSKQGEKLQRASAEQNEQENVECSRGDGVLTTRRGNAQRCFC